VEAVIQLNSILLESGRSQLIASPDAPSIVYGTARTIRWHAIAAVSRLGADKDPGFAFQTLPMCVMSQIKSAQVGRLKFPLSAR
jgi:hypothetical protein